MKKIIQIVSFTLLLITLPVSTTAGGTAINDDDKLITNTKHSSKVKEKVTSSSSSSWFRRFSHKQEELSHLHFYFHDVVTGKNRTVLRVAESPLSKTLRTQFGFLNVVDDKLTNGIDPSSEEVGRAQGIYGSSDLNELAYVTVINFAFTAGRFAGSSLCVVGRNAILDKNRELAVVGGTGRFRLARGVAVLNTVKRNATTRNAVVEYDVFVLHY